MGATVKDCTTEVVVEETAAPADVAAATGRTTTETEADKIRWQMRLRRKTRLARRALMARRTR